MSNNAEMHFCTVCNIPTKKKCNACDNQYYCSKEHQKSDWKNHRKNCKIKLVEDDMLGQHYVATRNIEADEVIFIEKQALLEFPHFLHEVYCVNCYATLAFIKSCYKCGWPLCSQCTKHGPECELTLKYRKRKIIFDETTNNWKYLTVPVLRAISLRNKCPADYEKFLKGEDRIVEAINGSFADSLVAAYCKSAKSLKSYMMIDDMDEAEIAKIIGIVMVHGILNASNKKIIVFEKTRYIAHSCESNTVFLFWEPDENKSGVVVQARKEIKKGQGITFHYYFNMTGTLKRRKWLRKNKLADCSCKRCKDPTELGTMISAIKCFETECTGYMLPSTFLASTFSEIPDFVCNKCNCAMPAIIVTEQLSKIKNDCTFIGHVPTLRKTIKEMSKFLHSNHYLILHVEFSIFRLLCEIDVKFQPSELLISDIMTLKKLSDILEVMEMPYILVVRILRLKLKFLNALKFRRLWLSQLEDFNLIMDLHETMSKLRELEPKFKHVFEVTAVDNRSNLDTEFLIF